MKNRPILAFTSLVTLLWIPSLLAGYENFSNFFYWRHQLIMYTGTLGFGSMCLAVLLAARFSWTESLVKGLDKGYALHKSLGIYATVTLTLHWLAVKMAHWLIDAGVLSPPNRGPRPEIEGINWHSVAEQVGDISFKVFLIFSFISLVQAISYKKFRFTHKLGGILVLVGIFHSLLLLDWNVSSVPLNLAIIALSAVGLVCSLLSLTGRIGSRNRVSGEVKEVHRFKDDAGNNSVVRFSVSLKRKLNYREGQFAYLDFHDGEAPHPFSLLNYDPESQIAEFGVKALGDYTSLLVDRLECGNQVTIEGSYGRFQTTELKNQVWIGAGIGIVPFVSRLYWLNRKAEKELSEIERVVLYYCVNSRQEAFFEKEIIRLLGKLEFIELQILDAEKGELLSGEQVAGTMAGNDYDVSFCGPVTFSRNLQSALFATGLPPSRFHQEIFRMR